MDKLVRKFCHVTQKTNIRWTPPLRWTVLLPGRVSYLVKRYYPDVSSPEGMKIPDGIIWVFAIVSLALNTFNLIFSL